MPPPKPCKQPGCDGKKDLPSHFCYWHRIERLLIDEQIEFAMARRQLTLKTHPVRATVPADQWPAGRRFCSGCQFMVPLWYTSGAKCKACQSHASYSSHLASTYKISYDTYLAMLKFQDWRCYLCRKQPRTRRLAVDHDHESGKLRGLLCSGERSCNHDVLGNITSLAMAKRIVSYLETPPYELMLAGRSMPDEVATAGPVVQKRETTIMPQGYAGQVGTREIMEKISAEALERRARAADPTKYSDGDWLRWPEGAKSPLTVLNAVPDIHELELWEKRCELEREKQAKRASS